VRRSAHEESDVDLLAVLDDVAQRASERVPRTSVKPGLRLRRLVSGDLERRTRGVTNDANREA
jgi:hypothetical protein